MLTPMAWSVTAVHYHYQKQNAAVTTSLFFVVISQCSHFISAQKLQGGSWGGGMKINYLCGEDFLHQFHMLICEAHEWCPCLQFWSHSKWPTVVDWKICCMSICHHLDLRDNWPNFLETRPCIVKHFCWTIAFIIAITNNSCSIISKSCTTKVTTITIAQMHVSSHCFAVQLQHLFSCHWTRHLLYIYNFVAQQK